MNQFNDTLLRDTVQNMSKPIQMNPNDTDEYTIQGFVTNATLNDTSTYHLHSVNEFKRGDFTYLSDNKFYMVTDDVIHERGSKYKAKIEYCNYVNVMTKTEQVIAGFVAGRPYYETVTTVIGNFVGIIKQRALVIPSTSGVAVGNTETILMLKDTTQAKEYYTVNKEFEYDGKSWKVQGLSNINKGILEIRLTTV